MNVDASSADPLAVETCGPAVLDGDRGVGGMVPAGLGPTTPWPWPRRCASVWGT